MEEGDSNIIEQQEVFSPIKGKIILPAEFDSRFKTELAFRAEVAGFTTLSLTHLRQGVSGEDFEVVRYGSDSVYVGLQTPIFREGFGSGFGYDFSHYSEEDLVKGNTGYGNRWGVNEAYRQVVNLKPLDFDFHMMLSELADALRLSDPFSGRLPTFEEVTRLMTSPYEVDSAQFREVVQNFIDHFGSTEKFHEYLLEQPKHQGVQVIYGNREDFVKFVKSLPEKSYAIADLAEQPAMILETDIPDSLVKYVVPLGSFEQSVLKT